MTDHPQLREPRDQKRRALTAWGAFIDRLIQTFEDRRPGLKDETLRKGEQACERFFLDIYETERTRLAELAASMEHLTPQAQEAMLREVDRLVRTVVLPAYLRLTVRLTARERNDFFLAREGLHALERLGWVIAGLATGALVVWAPFIPLWSKEWVIPFSVAGFFVPNLRAYLALRRYEREINDLVGRADREVGRIDVAYLLGAASSTTPVQPICGELAPGSTPNKTEVH